MRNLLSASPRPRNAVIGPAIGLGLTLALVLAGCGGEGEEEAPRGPHIEMPERAAPADALEARLQEQSAEIATYMLPHDDVLRGRGAAGRPPEEFTKLLRLGFCYKIVGVGDDGVEDLDVMLYSPDQVLLQRDTTRASTAVIGSHRAICPSEPGIYRIQVRVREGEGEFALQFFRSI